MPRKSSATSKQTAQKSLPPHTVSTEQCDTFGDYVVLRVPVPVGAVTHTRLLVIDARPSHPEQDVYQGPVFDESITRVLFDTRRAILYASTPHDDTEWIHAWVLRYHRQVVHLDSAFGPSFTDWQLDPETGQLLILTADGLKPVERFAKLKTEPDPEAVRTEFASDVPTNLLAFMLRYLLPFGPWQTHQARKERLDDFGLRIVPGEYFFASEAVGWGYNVVLSWHSAMTLWTLFVSREPEQQLRQAFFEQKPPEFLQPFRI